MTHPITPATFGQMLIEALDFRSQGESTITAASRASYNLSFTTDWALPICCILSDSPSLAEDWAKRMFQQELERTAKKMESL